MKIITKKQAIQEASRLLSGNTFSRESASKVQALLNMAELLGTGEIKPEKAAFVPFDRQLRDLSTVSTNQYFVAHQYEKDFLKALRAYNEIFKTWAHNEINTATGGPLRISLLDDTANASSVISEGSQVTEEDPETGVVDFTATCPTYRALVYVSRELLEDSGIDCGKMLMEAFAIRHARGAGKDILAVLQTAASENVTVTAEGDPNSSSQNGSTQIGYPDLIALMKSLDPLYRAQAVWCFNSDTLLSIAGLVTKEGLPIFPRLLEQGELMGRPVAICPDMPEQIANAVSVILYTPRHLCVRRVPSFLTVAVYPETKAEYALVGFGGYYRVQAAWGTPLNGPSPVVALQQASSS